MTINTRPTFNYSQPTDYRFSHDSVFLAQVVFDRAKSRIQRQTRILDLCAGCGIVGMDFVFHCRSELGYEPETVDFLEVQSEYLMHFQENKVRLNSAARLIFLNQCYSELLSQKKSKYDFILCNPPYFHADQGKLSPSMFKSRCRFFLDSDTSTLFRSIHHSLRPEGEAYVLVRNLEDLKAVPPELVVEQIDEIRGTPLILLRNRHSTN